MAQKPAVGKSLHKVFQQTQTHIPCIEEAHLNMKIRQKIMACC